MFISLFLSVFRFYDAELSVIVDVQAISIYAYIFIDICPLRTMLNFYKRSNKIVEVLFHISIFSSKLSKHLFLMHFIFYF